MTILTYHSVDETGSVLSVSPDVLAAHLASLARCGHRGVSLAEAWAEREALGAWPERTVALTFDDGYLNVHRAAFPLLRRHGFTATVYLVADAVGGVNDWEAPPARLGSQPLLGWEEAEELSAAGWEMGSHARTHPDLRDLAPDELEREIAGSRDLIARRLGRPVPTFAYPYGRVCDAATAVVARHYLAGVTTVLKRVGDEPPALLPRVDAYYWRGQEDLGPLVSGRRDAYLTARRWARAVKARTLQARAVGARAPGTRAVGRRASR